MRQGSVYELRTYTVAEGRLPLLLDRFEADSLPLLERHGIEAVGLWTTIADPPSFVYLVRHARDPERAWTAFYDDPQWAAIAGEPALEGAVTSITSQYLAALPFARTPRAQ